MFVLDGGQPNVISWKQLPGSSTLESVNGKLQLVTDGHILFVIPAVSAAELQPSGSAFDESLQIKGVSKPVSFDGQFGVNRLAVNGAGTLIDWTESSPRLAAANVERVDIRDGNASHVVLSVESVATMLSGRETLYLYLDGQDSLDVGTGWNLVGTDVVDGKFVRVIASAKSRAAIHGPSDWQNPVNPLDVNHNGKVEPLDALNVINELNDPQFHDASGRLTDAASLPVLPQFLFDPNGDGFVAPLDVLVIINFLNNSNAVAEGEATRPTFPIPLTSWLDQPSSFVSAVSVQPVRASKDLPKGVPEYTVSPAASAAPPTERRATIRVACSPEGDELFTDSPFFRTNNDLESVEE